MIDLILNTGVLNITLWMVVFTVLTVVGTRFVSHRSQVKADNRLQGLTGLFTSLPVVILLAMGTCLTIGYGFYKGYTVPYDMLQDVISAQQLLAGKSLYPDNMSQLMREAVAREEPRFSLFWWSDGLRAKEIEARETCFQIHWVQAHPPLMTIVHCPLVAWGGIAGTYAVLCLVSLAGLTLSLVLINRVLELPLSTRQRVVLFLVILAWDVIVTTLRSGQLTLILMTLMILGWYWLRQGRPIVAGIAIAVATCLKLYPGLLLVYFLLRHRVAFVSALVTMVIISGLVGMIAGWDSYFEYSETARHVMLGYYKLPKSVSLLGFVARYHPESWGFAHLLPDKSPEEVQFIFSRILFLVLVLLILAFVSWVLLRGKDQSLENDGCLYQLDLEYSLFMVLMVVFSPIAWWGYMCNLLLPLAVLGKQVCRLDTSRWLTLVYLGLIVILAIPDTTYTWPAENLTSRALFLLYNLPLSLRTIAMLIISYWLIRLLGSFGRRGNSKKPATPAHDFIPVQDVLSKHLQIGRMTG